VDQNRGFLQYLAANIL